MSEAFELARRFVAECSEKEQREILKYLREEYPIHPLERQWHCSAEMILDAISESTDLTQRGVKGVIADRAFHRLVVPHLSESGWTPEAFEGDQPFDALLRRGNARVSVQVKMQRREKGQPKVRVIGEREYWVVEVQKTRSGKNADGSATRPYAFGNFDILAVNLYASTNDWSSYLYTVARWLKPKRKFPHLIDTLQPVSKVPNEDWTDSFEECVEWLYSGVKKTIGL